MYDVSTNAILTAKAKAMVTDDLPQFTENTRLAERLLGVSGTSYSGTVGSEVQLAIAMQVNFQLATGVTPYIESGSSDKGTKQESVTYRQNQPLVDPRARALIDAVLLSIASDSNSSFTTVRSVRANSCSR